MTTNNSSVDTNAEQITSENSKSSYQYYYDRLKSLVDNDNSSNVKKYINDKLISDLATSLLDQTQVNNEHELMQQRDSMIAKLDAKRNDKIEEVETKFAIGEIPSFRRDDLLKEMKKHYEKKIVSIDTHILHRVDKCVRDQQKTLTDAEIPGFNITDNSNEIEAQIKLLNFIEQIINLSDESKLAIN
ncbi:DGCR6-like protein [Euroglyphus maynei]|uniref:DGCR6-like protein n=1 Tax=Euroglyphus maynei TaxID=6958 RepID=A0A1Y3BCK1_EURMA|nr:DGCR6-like protein [Euroglyphus maynei]